LDDYKIKFMNSNFGFIKTLTLKTANYIAVIGCYIIQ